MFCNECGNKLLDGAAFCGECGEARIGAVSAVSAPATIAGVAAAPRRISKKQAIIIGAVIAVIIIVIVIVNAFSSLTTVFPPETLVGKTFYSGEPFGYGNYYQFRTSSRGFAEKGSSRGDFEYWFNHDNSIMYVRYYNVKFDDPGAQWMYEDIRRRIGEQPPSDYTFSGVHSNALRYNDVTMFTIYIDGSVYRTR
jgi:hypothetical protein